MQTQQKITSTVTTYLVTHFDQLML